MRTVNVDRLVRCRQHHDPQCREPRLGTYPLDDFKPVGQRHLQVKQEQIRQRKFGALCVFALSLQVCNGLLSVLHRVQKHLDSRVVECPLQQKHVGLTIFGKQYYWHTTVWHNQVFL